MAKQRRKKKTAFEYLLDLVNNNDDATLRKVRTKLECMLYSIDESIEEHGNEALIEGLYEELTKRERERHILKIFVETGIVDWAVGKLFKMCCSNAENATLQDALRQIEIEEGKGDESPFQTSLGGLEEMVGNMVLYYGMDAKLSDLLEIRKESLGDLYDDEEYEEDQDGEDGVLDEPESESEPEPGSGDKVNWKKEGF